MRLWQFSTNKYQSSEFELVIQNNMSISDSLQLIKRAFNEMPERPKPPEKNTQPPSQIFNSKHLFNSVEHLQLNVYIYIERPSNEDRQTKRAARKKAEAWFYTNEKRWEIVNALKLAWSGRLPFAEYRLLKRGWRLHQNWWVREKSFAG